MHQLTCSADWSNNLQDQVAIVTGSSRGIGASTISTLNKHGAFTVIADLPRSQADAETLIGSLPFPERALFVAANVTDWRDMVQVFKESRQRFGKVDIVIANAGIMETSAALDVKLDDAGDPIESTEICSVFDVNLKGTMNSKL